MSLVDAGSSLTGCSQGGVGLPDVSSPRHQLSVANKVTRESGRKRCKLSSVIQELSHGSGSLSPLPVDLSTELALIDGWTYPKTRHYRPVIVVQNGTYPRIGPELDRGGQSIATGRMDGSSPRSTDPRSDAMSKLSFLPYDPVGCRPSECRAMMLRQQRASERTDGLHSSPPPPQVTL
ncbi:unnamed protein product [Soboliphyme baturini]|uniref:Uncharacterized protein n=1 Tax=Soboliphyme baturini TaxID=241478 RepID=A0A183IRA6_9BILA|nr:unnamed protein product [Soboliphyme baturini]